MQINFKGEQYLESFILIVTFDNSVHDKKISVLGFCALLQCPRRPSAVLNNARHFVPAILVQLKALVQSYQGDVCMYCML